MMFRMKIVLVSPTVNSEENGRVRLQNFVLTGRSNEGAVQILGEICPRSDPDFCHMGYYLGPLKLNYSMPCFLTKQWSHQAYFVSPK